MASPVAASGVADQLVVYPVVEGMPRNGDFTVKVRTPGQKWQDIATYLVKVATGVDTRAPAQRPGLTTQSPLRNASRVGMGPQDSSIASFDFSGVVEVAITCNRGAIESARVRPLSYEIAPLVNGNTITFSLQQPINLSVEVNGDIFHNLQLFASSIETSRPDPNDPNVIYYGPGIHEIGTVAISSGKTVYLAAGSLVEGALIINNAENIRIFGRGILSQPRGNASSISARSPPGAPERIVSPANVRRTSRRDAVLIEFSKNIEVEGIIVVPTSYTVLVGQSRNVAIRNIKSVSAGANNDGIDIFDSSDVNIDNVFMRNSDDNIAIYGHRWSYYGDTRHVVVKNSTLWADAAHPILVGTHGDSAKPDLLDDITFLNIDILEQREPQLDYQGCMSLNAGDSNSIRNVRFENIRVEDFTQGQLLNMRVFYNRKYNTSPGAAIENVIFKDISYRGTHANPSIIAGYDETRQIRHIAFENLQVNGRIVADDMAGKPGYFKTGDMADIFIGEHVEDITFSATARTR
jgi:hypothetical protein